MNQNIVSIIKRIIAEQGEAILSDAARLKGIFADYAAQESKPERLVFGRCIEYGAYTELKNARDAQSRSLVKAAVAQKVHSNEGLEAALCNEALDALEAALFGIQPQPPQQAYQPPPQTPPPAYQQQTYQAQSQVQPPVYQQQITSNQSDKSKIAAGLLAIFLGTFGVHNFYLGHTSKGVIQLVLCIVGFITTGIVIGALLLLGVAIWAIVEGIQCFTGSYKDAQGRDLRD